MILTGASVIALCMICVGVWIIKMLVADDSQKRHRRIQQITMLKPPPPPKVKEMPPPPEIKKKDEIVEQPPEETPPEDQQDASDEPPPGDDLGLDADGSGGADGFGLRAKKGGRALIGGGLGTNSLLRKYAWYTEILQSEIRKRVRKYLEENGGVPSGSLNTYVKIRIDAAGRINNFKIYGSSGNASMDQAVTEAIKITQFGETPPDGMPLTMKLKISSKG
ncbi:MAG: TonB family protein [Pseudomonadota bacterium]